MRKVLTNLIIYILLVLVIAVGVDYLSMHGYTRDIIADITYSSEYFVNNGPEFVNPIIRQAQTDDGTTKLLIGDSVCYQMFYGLKDYNPHISFLASNGAVTMAGQYAIAKEYLDNHPYATDIYLIVLPESISRTFDTKWGYQYAVLPFVETDTLGDYDENTIEIIKETYGEIFTRRMVAKAIDASGINRKLYLNYRKKLTDGYKLVNDFELADQYLTKLEELCERKGVNFYLLPCPVIEGNRGLCDVMQDEFLLSETCRINPEFFNMVYYYPSEYSDDGVHLSVKYRTREFMDDMIEKMLEGHPLLKSLNFS